MRRGRGRGRGAAALAVLAFGGLTAGPAQAGWPVAEPGEVTITRTEQSIPNIVADDFAGGGYGVGYAMAEDNICVMADFWLTLRAERAKYPNLAPPPREIVVPNDKPLYALEADAFYAAVTGSTPFMPYLKKHRDETGEHRIG